MKTAIKPFIALAVFSFAAASAAQRFLIVTDIKDSSQAVLRQAEAQEANSTPAKNP